MFIIEKLLYSLKSFFILSNIIMNSVIQTFFLLRDLVAYVLLFLSSRLKLGTLADINIVLYWVNIIILIRHYSTY